MKVLKWIIILIVCVIVGALIFSAFFAPAKLDKEETIVIDAPKEQVYAQYIDFKNWDEWAAWNQIDTAMEKDYSEEMGEVGSWTTWRSDNWEVGTGRQEIVEIKPNEYVKTAMTFEGWDDPSYSELILEETEEGTRTTWTFKTPKTPWYARIMNSFMEADLEEKYEKSLNQLKHLVESKKDEYGNEAHAEKWGLEVIEMPGRQVISILDSTTAEGISKKLTELYTELSIYDEMHDNVKVNGMPLAIYHQYSPEKVVLEAAMPVDATGANGEGRLKVKKLHEGKAVKGIHYGDYNLSEDMHIAIDTYLQDHGWELAGGPIEIYANDPTTVDSADVETHIIYPIR
jgi:effector-binding domain-containing protein